MLVYGHAVFCLLAKPIIAHRYSFAHLIKMDNHMSKPLVPPTINLRTKAKRDTHNDFQFEYFGISELSGMTFVCEATHECMTSCQCLTIHRVFNRPRCCIAMVTPVIPGISMFEIYLSIGHV